jgi:ribonuclease-3
MAPPSYDEAAREGPDHQPIFTVRVTLADGNTEEARAGSKRQAEQMAARALLARIEGLK